MMGVV
ncbi:hypothetical protein EC80569_0305, partial [Escherichia coli 8.0569]